MPWLEFQGEYSDTIRNRVGERLRGARSLTEGVPTWLLGVLLHFVIAFSVAAIYCFFSRKLEFLKRHFLASLC
jgi:uncharacterized membrane protein (DUF485 family)